MKTYQGNIRRTFSLDRILFYVAAGFVAGHLSIIGGMYVYKKACADLRMYETMKGME